MASNVLFLPFRRTHPVSLSEAIKRYISTKYDQHPDVFTKDLQTIDTLRSAAVALLEAHSSGVRKIQAYAAQLVWMGGKFPIDIGVDFVWYPALGYDLDRPIAQNNLRFELANVLYNMAALYSQLAISSNRGTSDGLKAACNYFCLSAGVISHLKTSIIHDMRSIPPDDMDDATLESLEHLLLAQAQECFWQKAVKDGLKDASIAKLAAKVSDFYMQAGDLAIKSDSISSEWIHHMFAKHHHFAAAAQFRAARDSLEKRNYGEEVARLKGALTCVDDGLKEARYLNKVVLADMNGLRNKIQEDLKRAEKDNDMIYLQRVPPKSELKLLDRASMAAAKIPPEVSDPLSMLGDHGVLGKPLFSKLVPYSVHVAASIYVDRRDRLVNDIIDELESMTARIYELLQTLNLPGSLQALEKPLGLPPGIVSHAEEIRQQDGLGNIYRSIEETQTIRNQDKIIYQEGLDLLRSEAAEDEQNRRRWGTERWTRPPAQEAAPELYARIEEIDGYLNSAEKSDKLVHAKLKEQERLIRLLSGTDRDLEDFVPSSRRAIMTAQVEREANKLRGSLSEVSRLESRRRRKFEALRSKAKADDINPDLLKEASRLEREWPMQKLEAAQFEDFFEQRLHRYDADKTMAEEEKREQEEVLQRLKEANGAFTLARRGDTATKEREHALQRLENAYFKYKEIVSNLDVGRRFYNDLAKIVTRFRDDARNFVYQRRAEAERIEADISTAMYALDLSKATALHEQRQAQTHKPQYAAKPRPDPPLAAPVPTRAPMTSPSTPGMWTPEMGIKFGGTTAAQVNGHQTEVRDARWDPARGLKFG